MTRRIALVALVLAACKGKHAPPHAVHDDARPADAGAAVIDASVPWPELATITKAEPVRVIALPARQDLPRFDVGGPVLLGELAIVCSSQFGFLAVDYKRGQIAWSKPAGLRVAPPIVVDHAAVLIGECLNPPDVPDQLLGCARVVTAAGGDQGYVAIHGKDVAAFAGSPGEQRVWASGEHAVTWKRGDEAVTVDLLTGAAKKTAADLPPVVVHYKDHTWEITRADDGVLHAREHGKDAWHTQRSYTALIGAVYLPEQSPMIRMSNIGAFGGHPEMNLFDIDATGSLHGQVAFPVPGIGLIGQAIDSVGDTALAIRLDRSLRRDFIVGYAANALLMWVYPLPEIPRADPVGLAVAPDAVVVFHDGDTFTVLPELSAPPTAPGAARPPSENSTP